MQKCRGLGGGKNESGSWGGGSQRKGTFWHGKLGGRGGRNSPFIWTRLGTSLGEGGGDTLSAASNRCAPRVKGREKEQKRGKYSISRRKEK